MRFMSNQQQINQNATLRFRRNGAALWEVRSGVRSVRKYIESVGDKPDDEGYYLGSDWGQGEKWRGETMPDHQSWQILDEKSGKWRGLCHGDFVD